MNKYFFLTVLFLALLAPVKKDKAESETTASTPGIPSSVFYVRTALIEERQLSDVIHITGIIQSESDAKPSFKTGGIIANTYVKEGDAVKKGSIAGQAQHDGNRSTGYTGTVCT
jgi:multidrug efflux pump subunit AcrA (membrane-fusion protein)